jgi:hypothetical protein
VHHILAEKTTYLVTRDYACVFWQCGNGKKDFTWGMDVYEQLQQNVDGASCGNIFM